ncbi:MAG: tRNA (adenosine(37)-N6)-threonylcarbamoyltransferase complex dimerization subunit type 1 TsaB [Candidatus Omnitrophica bacterium]|nr:tRNA (adenosine(37)-N6)-threonylcarbamoyltransferase complex dimerization subunit type 1 TsaB [Candidatus Omnitrophota bacterium]MDO9573248.1 tRNA (adenosine(37)-N6)-threonylcarbamoyltransferase complex dimerization subunit type 1 TsaB [Candidatus Omnitrophota bacterium]
MKILGIDTTTKFICLGLYVDGSFYEYNLGVGRSMSKLLAPTIQRVLTVLGLKIADIDYFACGLGPGSFTGMRIGLATVKGLSVVRDKPVIGVSSLDILAKNVLAEDSLIVSSLDAGRGLIYCSSYNIEHGILKRKSKYALLTLDEFISKFNHKPIILGSAVSLYREKLLSSIKGARVLDKDHWRLQAHNLIDLALTKIKARQFSSALTIKPIYLYPKECQIKIR